MKRQTKIKIIVIAGPTATGKSDFAVAVAKKINGEVISADSRQVYTGMDIGTGKITVREMRNIPHHLLDVITPKKTFTVAQYKKLADKKIQEIHKRRSVVIICGGTGFYIDTVTTGQTLPEVPPNSALRKKLALLSTTQLFEKLKKLDKNRAENIDKNNPVRLIRAIEIATALGKVPPLNTSPHPSPTLGEGATSPYEVLYIGLTLPDEVLKENIKTRLLKRMRAGMVAEIKRLHDSGITWMRMYDLGLEYRYLAEYVQGKMKKEEMLEKLNNEIWHYAKRQKTWFKRNNDIIWIDPRDAKQKEGVVEKVKEFLK